MRTDPGGLDRQFPAAWRWIRISRRINGWLTDGEANSLFELARTIAPQEDAVVVELGSWQGKSSVLLAAGLRHKTNARLFCIDPFAADENAAYQANYYDPLISGMRLGLEDTFRKNIRRCGLEAFVRIVRGYSYDAVQNWNLPIDILFIDASHELESVRRDFLSWAPFVKKGGVVAMHDVSPIWPGPSQVMADHLQPPEFAGIQQADSLAWAMKQIDGPVEAAPRHAAVLVARSDFDRRQSEISRLMEDLAYVQGENRRLSEALSSVETRPPAELSDQESLVASQAAFETSDRELALALVKTNEDGKSQGGETESVDRAAQPEEGGPGVLGEQRHRERELAAELQAARQSISALRASWSWRLTAPLRGLVVALRLIGSGAAARADRATAAGLVQWILFRGIIRNSGLFDSVYYFESNPDVPRTQDPLFHWFLFGARERRKPNPLFDTAYYVASNSDIAVTWLNPLLHYIRWGALEGRNPHPDFDAAYYLDQNADIREARLNPLAHYLGAGVAEGRKPNIWFDTIEYLERHPDLASGGLNPLAHFLQEERVRALEWSAAANPPRV